MLFKNERYNAAAFGLVGLAGYCFWDHEWYLTAFAFMVVNVAMFVAMITRENRDQRW